MEKPAEETVNSFWSEVELHAASVGGRRRLIAAVRDIEQRVQAEETLRRQEERLASRDGGFRSRVGLTSIL